MVMSVETIKQVLKEQNSIKLPNSFVKCDAYRKLQQYSKLPEIIIITGLRRVGKSTLLQQLRTELPESDYYTNFDDDRLVHFELEDFQKLLETFIELYGIQKTFYFDEIQNIKGWEVFIRRLHDQGNKIYISGSNATLFSQELGTRLTGRYLQMELYPYSFSEMLYFRFPTIDTPVTTEERGLTAKTFTDYRVTGGIPAYVNFAEIDVLQSLYKQGLA